MGYFGKVSRSPEETCNIGEGLDRTYTVRYDVVLDLSLSDSTDASPLQIYNGLAGLPKYGQPWQSYDGQISDPYATMRTFSGRREHSEKAQYSFTFNYSVRGNTRGVDPSRAEDRYEGTGGADDISKLLPVWSVTFEDRMIPLREDLSDPVKQAQNAAGTPLEPLPEFNDHLMVINYSDYITLDISTPGLLTGVLTDYYAYKYRTNADDFLLTPGDADKWLISDVSLHPELLGMGRVFRRDFVFKFSFSGWTDRYLNAGLEELIAGGGGFAEANRRPILRGTTRQPVTRPWPLNADGTAVTNLAAGNLNYLSFKTKLNRPFAPLNVRLV